MFIKFVVACLAKPWLAGPLVSPLEETRGDHVE
jgi:hypothetical protein